MGKLEEKAKDRSLLEKVLQAVLGDKPKKKKRDRSGHRHATKQLELLEREGR